MFSSRPVSTSGPSHIQSVTSPVLITNTTIHTTSSDDLELHFTRCAGGPILSSYEDIQDYDVFLSGSLSDDPLVTVRYNAALGHILFVHRNREFARVEAHRFPYEQRSEHAGVKFPERGEFRVLRQWLTLTPTTGTTKSPSD